MRRRKIKRETREVMRRKLNKGRRGEGEKDEEGRGRKNN